MILLGLYSRIFFVREIYFRRDNGMEAILTRWVTTICSFGIIFYWKLGRANFEKWQIGVFRSFMVSSTKPVDFLPVLCFNVEISLYGRSIYVCVVARRSRYFAGARFLKRGVNDKVYLTAIDLTIGICSKWSWNRTNCFGIKDDLVPCTRWRRLREPTLDVICTTSRKYSSLLDSRCREH